MVIVGAKGFAKEVLEILSQNSETETIAFFDNVSIDLPDLFYDRFRVLRNVDEIAMFFKQHGFGFTLGIGNPINRFMLSNLMTEHGGVWRSTISPYARIGHFNNKIGIGANIMTGSIITNDVTIGKGLLMNLNCTIGHDSIIGDFTEMSPGVHISGNCKIGPFCNLGTNASILPKIELGENIIVGAGTVVTKNVPSNSLVVGIPGQVIKSLPPLKF